MDLSKNAFFKICVNRYHERNEPEWDKKIRNRDDTLSELEQVAAHGRKKQMLLIHVPSTNTHRKCNKALSGEIIFSSHVLTLMLLCRRFLEFAAEDRYCCTTGVKNDLSVERVYTKHFSCVTCSLLLLIFLISGCEHESDCFPQQQRSSLDVSW